ncbi:MAG: hypothetical protein ABH842_02250 [Candidatus Micrarchaeota archaeon]
MGVRLRTLRISEQKTNFKDLPQASQSVLLGELEHMKVASDRMQVTISDILRPHGKGKPTLAQVRFLLGEGVPLYILIREQVPTKTLLSADHDDVNMAALTNLISATTTLVSTASMVFEDAIQDIHDEVSGVAAKFSKR